MYAFSSSSYPPNQQVDASFSHSLLRVVPFDDHPVLATHESPSPSSGATVTADSGRWGVAGGGPGCNVSGGGGSGGGGSGVANATLAEGVLRGGDLVRLCHLSSTGFLTHETMTTLQGEKRKREDIDQVGSLCDEDYQGEYL